MDKKEIQIMSEKVYSRVMEAEEMIAKLCEKQPKLLWRVRPQTVQVWGVENKERADGNKTLAKIKAVKGVEKAIMQDANLSVRYHLDIYWSDWKQWKENQKQGILIHELLHIHEEPGKLIKHDIEDFRILLDKTGVKDDSYENFPDVFINDVEFDMNLLPKTEEIEEEEKDEIDEEEIVKRKRGRPRKNPENKPEEKPEDDSQKTENKDESLADSNPTESKDEKDGDLF